MEELKSLVGILGRDIVGFRDEIAEFAASNIRLKKIVRLAVIVAIIGVLVGGVGLYLGWRASSNTNCIKGWANDTGHVNKTLRDANKDRQTKQDAYLGALTKIVQDALAKKDDAVLNNDFKNLGSKGAAYGVAALKYKDISDNNPAPLVSQFNCHF